MIKSDTELHSTKRLATQLETEIAELSEMLEHNFQRELADAMELRKKQFNHALDEIAEYEACLRATSPPVVISVVSDSPPRTSTYDRGLFFSRLARGVSQAEIAKRLDCSQGLVSRWEGAAPVRHSTIELQHSDIDQESRRDIKLSTVQRWGHALGYSLSAYFLDRNAPPMTARAVPPLAFDLIASLSQFEHSPDRAVRSAMRSIRVFSDADCVSCYVPDSQSNVLQLAFCEGVDYPKAMTGLVWDYNVPMSLLALQDRRPLDWIPRVCEDDRLRHSLFTIRERITSMAYVTFDALDGKGILFLNYRQARHFEDDDLRAALGQLSHLLSYFFTSLKPSSTIVSTTNAHDGIARQENWTAELLVDELIRYSSDSDASSELPSALPTQHNFPYDLFVIEHDDLLNRTIRPLSGAQPLSNEFRKACLAVAEFREESKQATLIVDASDMPPSLAERVQCGTASWRGIFASPMPYADAQRERLLVGFVRREENDRLYMDFVSTAYHAIIGQHCNATAQQLVEISPVRSKSRSTKQDFASRLIESVRDKLKGKCPRERAESACQILNDMYGAVATDVWCRAENGDVSETAFAACHRQDWETRYSREEILAKLTPRPRGVTWRLLNSPRPRPLVVPDATRDSQFGKGTRDLKLKTIIAVPIIGPTNLWAEAVLWIRFAAGKSQFFELSPKNRRSRSREVDLLIIANFLYLLAFKDKYERLIGSAAEIVRDLSQSRNLLVNRRAFRRFAQPISSVMESDEFDFQ